MTVTFSEYTDEWGRLCKWSENHKAYVVNVDGVWHSMSDEGEPYYPIDDPFQAKRTA